MTENRLRLTILGGFPGGGMTTWLRHGLKAHVLMNEAAGLAVEGALLSGASGITVLPGGCACCDGRALLLAALHGLADRRSRGEAIAELILETSGLADPAGIMDAIAQDPVLVHDYRIVATAVLVDAENAFADGSLSMMARQQMQAADCLILTKNDTVSSAHGANLVATLKRLNPLAVLSAAIAGQTVPLSPEKGQPLDLRIDDARPFQAETLQIPSEADWAAVSLWLLALLHGHGAKICRIKGVVHTPSGRLLIQTVRHSVQPPEILPEDCGISNELAFIGRLGNPSRLRASLDRFLRDQLR